MATLCRHTFSGVLVAGVLAVSVVARPGGVPAASADEATEPQTVASQSCPQSWPALRSAPPPGDAFDGNVSVLVGGNLHVTGSAAGAEGTVVTMGDATFSLDAPGAYEVGATALGSQVTPFAGSDMLVVGGNLTGAPGTHIDVGQGLGGDVVLGGVEADGTDLDGHGGRVDPSIADATAPYADLAGGLASKSAAFAALPTTGGVDDTLGEITLEGDGVSDPQVFDLDGQALAHGVVPHTLAVTGVPQGAAIIVNLTGPSVDLDLHAVRGGDGLPIDPTADPAFADLATHLLWNAPDAASVEVGGEGQLPGSLLVPTPGSTTTISGSTNGRILVGGDLVHAGAGEMHAYPFLDDPQLTCGADPVHMTDLTLSVDLLNGGRDVDPDFPFEGRFQCVLGGADVTPGDGKWQVRAGSGLQVLSDRVPAGATCTVSEQLDGPPGPSRAWAEPTITPDTVVAVKRQQHGFTITNRVVALPDEPTPTQSTPSPTVAPTTTPVETAPEPPASASVPPSSAPSSLVEPTNGPDLPSSPSALPSAPEEATDAPSVDDDAPDVSAAHNPRLAGPLTTTAPFTLRGAFVWGPMLMLSLLTLLLRVRRRPKRQH